MSRPLFTITAPDGDKIAFIYREMKSSMITVRNGVTIIVDNARSRHEAIGRARVYEKSYKDEWAKQPAEAQREPA